MKYWEQTYHPLHQDENFHQEATLVAKPGAVIAAWCYFSLHIEDEKLNDLYNHFYSRLLETIGMLKENLLMNNTKQLTLILLLYLKNNLLLKWMDQRTIYRIFRQLVICSEVQKN